MFLVAGKLDQILVVDVESTCWDGPPPEGEESEIIEVGLCMVEVQSLTRLVLKQAFAVGKTRRFLYLDRRTQSLFGVGRA